MINFSKLCTPAKIYFAIAVIATIFDLFNGASFMFAFWKMIFAFVWTFILGGLCDKGYKSISWVLVLLPYILMFLASLNIYHVTDEQRQFMRSIQLQGAYGQEAFTEGAVSGSAVQTAAQTTAQTASQTAAIKTLSESEISALVKQIISSAGSQQFLIQLRKFATSSLEALKSRVVSDITNLNSKLSTAATPSEKHSIQMKMLKQDEKLTLINNVINERPK